MEFGRLDAEGRLSAIRGMHRLAPGVGVRVRHDRAKADRTAGAQDWRDDQALELFGDDERR